IVGALELALGRADAVIVCGGLGPTQDDITRNAIARVMGVRLVQDDAVVDRILERFAARGRRMPANNLLQAQVPEGATAIADPQPGTAPGLICPVGEGGKVIYAVPGVPYEMQEIVAGAVLPDMRRRAGKLAIIRSRTLRTWGDSESGLAERLAEHMAELDDAGPEAPTLAFLASGIEGLKVRITVKADDDDVAGKLLDDEERVVRGIVGDIVFGVDEETMEHAVAKLLVRRGLTLAVAESLTGGLVSSRLVNVPGASGWFRGGIVSYSTDVKHDLLGVSEGPVVTSEAAAAMAAGVRRRLHADIGLAVTGVAGPDEQEGQPPGTVFMAVALGDDEPIVVRVGLPGDRDRVRQFACIALLDLLRRRLERSAEASARDREPI
ncbi:MAG TPA: CinA family nicotinamide mononucleotide deamidase-related protein, partial [Acidimicrobiales bacterium]|nr:CinA family nicotinamide mononucleotide deamidase-related protein [Acidimicrobiales bacterium]